MKYFPIIDTRESTIKFLNQIKKVTKNEKNSFVDNESDADMFLVIGGDGYFLQAMRKYHGYKKPFFGLHAGTLGFLMNHLSTIDALPGTMGDLQYIKSALLEITCKDKEGKMTQAVSINDCIIGNSTLDYFRYNVEYGTKSEKIAGTGLVLSTSIGSTGYALNNGVPLMPLDSDLWCLNGLAARPFHYHFLKPEKITITIEGKSPCIVGCDGHGHIIQDVTEVIVMPSKKSVTIAFCPSQEFQSKRLMMAEEKLG